jgi:hypothetical protein
VLFGKGAHLAAVALAVCCCGIALLAGSAIAPHPPSPIDLSLVLTNSGLELGNTNNWTATMPNSQYISPVPVDPAIQPLDPCCTNGTLLPI